MSIADLVAEAARIRAAQGTQFSWDELREIVLKRELWRLHRSKDTEALYAGPLKALINAQYGSAGNYILHRLGWTDVRVNAQPSMYTFGVSMERLLPNDWPYSVPCEHMLLWTRDQLVPNNEDTREHGLSGDHEECFHDTTYSAEIKKAVRYYFPPSCYDVLWFVNPPRLQSVPTVSHVQIFARKKGA